MAKNSIEELTEFFESVGFNQSEIRRLIFSYNRFKDNFNSISELRETYAFYHANMEHLGYNESEIHLLASTHPKSIFQKFSNGQIEEYYKKYLERVTEEESHLSIAKKIEYNREILMNLGIDKEKISGILKSNLPLTELSPKVLESNIGFYILCGISKIELQNIVNNNSTVLLYGEKEYAILFDEFPLFSSEDLGNMILFYSKNNTIVQPDCLYKTLKFSKNKRLDMNKLKKWLCKNMIKNLDEEELMHAYNGLIDIGFSEYQANKAASDNLSILYKQKEKIEYIIDVAKHYGVSKENIITIISGFATLPDLKDEKIKEKIAVMTRYGELTDYVVNHPKSLIQGADLIDARAKYLRLFYPSVKGSEFASNVFSQEKAFEKKYKRENEYIKELLPVIKNIKSVTKKV